MTTLLETHQDSSWRWWIHWSPSQRGAHEASGPSWYHYVRLWGSPWWHGPFSSWRRAKRGNPWRPISRLSGGQTWPNAVRVRLRDRAISSWRRRGLCWATWTEGLIKLLGSQRLHLEFFCGYKHTQRERERWEEDQSTRENEILSMTFLYQSKYFFNIFLMDHLQFQKVLISTQCMHVNYKFRRTMWRYFKYSYFMTCPRVIYWACS